MPVITLRITLANDVVPEELLLIKATILGEVNDHDSGAVNDAEWLEDQK